MGRRELRVTSDAPSRDLVGRHSNATLLFRLLLWFSPYSPCCRLAHCCCVDSCLCPCSNQVLERNVALARWNSSPASSDRGATVAHCSIVAKLYPRRSSPAGRLSSVRFVCDPRPFPLGLFGSAVLIAYSVFACTVPPLTWTSFIVRACNFNLTFLSALRYADYVT